MSRAKKSASNLTDFWRQVTDPFGAYQREFSQPDKPIVRITTGSITAAVPYCNYYTIQGIAGDIPSPTLGAVPAGMWDASPVGVRECSPYTVGTRVVVAYSEYMSHAVILGSLPYVEDPSLVTKADAIHQGLLCGFFQDDYCCRFIAQAEYGGDILNLNDGRPADAVGGDRTFLSDMGVGVVITRFTASLRADEAAQVQIFYHDQLVRITSYNYEHFTACSERRTMNDEGLWSDVELFTPYQVEGVGKKADSLYPSTDAFEDKDEQGQAPVEPTKPGQTGVWRSLDFRGYLGDLQRSYTAFPRYVTVAASYNTTKEGDDPKPEFEIEYFGLMDEWRGADGTYMLRSAKSITLVKTCVIPVPVQLHTPDDTNGFCKDESEEPDEIEPYKFAGEEDESAARPAMVLDEYAYLSNWYSLQSLEHMKQDWFVPDPETEDLQELYDFNRLSLDSRYSAELPDTIEADVSPKRKGVKYYKSLSMLHMADDGSITLTDGYGSQIIMAGGNITISPPGDVILRPGRNIVSLVPNDHIQRTGRHYEVTTTHGDVRIKADKNIMALAGAGEKSGGVLLESRASGTVSEETLTDVHGSDVQLYGITIKATEGAVAVYGKSNVMVRSTAGYVAIQTSEDHNIYTVSGHGVQHIVLSESGTIDFMFGVSNWMQEESIEADYYGTIGASVASMPGALFVNGVFGAFGDSAGILTDGYIIAGSHLNVRGTISAEALQTSGAIAAGGGVASRSGGELGALGARWSGPNFSSLVDTPLRTAGNTVDDLEDTGKGKVATVSSALTAAGYTDDLLNVLGFEFRTDEQYNVPDDFMFYETFWQQMYRILGLGSEWSEKALKNITQAGEQYPWPGKKLWKDDPHYGKFIEDESDGNYDISNRRPRKRGDTYTNMLPRKEGILDDEYKVTGSGE